MFQGFSVLLEAYERGTIFIWKVHERVLTFLGKSGNERVLGFELAWTIPIQNFVKYTFWSVN